MELGHKDVRLALDLAKDNGVKMPFIEMVNQRFIEQKAKGR